MSVLTDLPKILKSGIRKHGVPGASLCVYRNGRLTQAAAGVLNVETGVPVTTDSAFQIGSITKVFTATQIMQLADEGKVDIDAPIKTYLPDFAVADAGVSKSVTLRQMMSHTSGIEGDYFVESGRGDDNIANLQQMGRLLPQVYPPGERMSYCNWGYAMLGRVIEVVDAKTWDASLNDRLFDPLGMQQALSLPEDALRYRCAIGHVPNPKRKGQPMVTPMPWLAQGQKSAGATPMMSTADLMTFVHMHLSGGIAKSGDRLLSRSSVRAMQRQQIKLPPNSPRGASGWGLGWILMNYDGHKVFGHDGGTVGQFSFLRILPEKNLAVALFTNGGDANGLYESVFRQTFDQLGRVTTPEIPDPDPNLKTDPARLVGRYERMVGTVEISNNGDQLFVEGTADPSHLTGVTIPKTPIDFLTRDVAMLRSDNPALKNLSLVFQGNDKSRPDYVGVGFRLYRRI